MLLGLSDEHAVVEAALVEEALLQPLKEGLPLTERVTVPTPLADEERDMEVEAVNTRLPEDSPLPVAKNDPVELTEDMALPVTVSLFVGLPVRSPLTVDKKELVSLTVLLWLTEAHEEAEAALEEEALMLPLKEGLPLTESVGDSAKLTVAETEEDENAVLLPLAATEKEAEEDDEDDTLNEASWVLVLETEGESV